MDDQTHTVLEVHDGTIGAEMILGHGEKNPKLIQIKTREEKDNGQTGG